GASSGAGRSRAYSGGDLSTWKASRCAVFSPTPGRRARSSASRAMGSMTEGSLSAASLSLDQPGDEVLQAAQRARLLLRQRLHVGQGGVDRREDQVFQHRHVGLVHHLGIDLHAQELPASPLTWFCASASCALRSWSEICCACWKIWLMSKPAIASLLAQVTDIFDLAAENFHRCSHGRMLAAKRKP